MLFIKHSSRTQYYCMNRCLKGLNISGSPTIGLVIMARTKKCQLAKANHIVELLYVLYSSAQKSGFEVYILGLWVGFLGVHTA
jgi:hypothetical protein